MLHLHTEMATLRFNKLPNFLFFTGWPINGQAKSYFGNARQTFVIVRIG